MIRSALFRHNRFVRQRQVVSTQDAFVRCFSDRTPSKLRSAAQQTDDDGGSTSVSAHNDDDKATLQQCDSKSKFVPFFQEVDNLYGSSNNSKGGNEKITSFFQSLGDAPPDRVKTTMPAPSPTAAPSSLDSSNTLSIFDVFPIPDVVEETTVNENAYDEEAYRQYRDMIDEILANDRYQRRHTKRPFTDDFLAPIQTWLQAAEPIVEYKLPLFHQCVEQGLDTTSQDDDAFRSELAAQRQAFLKEVALNDKQYQQAIVALVLVGNLCAKRARSLPLDVAWEKVKEAGMLFDKSALNSYLYSCTMYVGSNRGTLFSAGDSVLDMLGSPLSTTTTTKEPKSDEKTDEEKKYAANLPEEVATFHDLLYEPTEESVTIRIKALVAKGNARAAEALLNHFSVSFFFARGQCLVCVYLLRELTIPYRDKPQGQEEGRQRTYLPILRCYLEQGDISSALRLLKQMRSSPLCILESETYIQLLSTMAERGCFR
jgi:pentatricopeptide repeat protein